ITNGVKENVWIQCRLDRAFGNAEWFSLFPRTHLQYLERLGSDHRPIFLSMVSQTQRRRGRFMCDIIKKHWRPVERSDGRDVTSVISSCRKDLAQWKRSDAGNSKKQIMQLRLQLEGEEKKCF
ncbi:unnamed protein product, partial [Brassica napus]